MILHISCILMVMVTVAYCAPGQDSKEQNILELARENKPKQRPSPSGTLDPLGGGHLLRINDPEEEKQLFQSLNSVDSHQGDFRDDMAVQAREDKPTPRPSSSGTLDSIGGGNLLRASDLNAEDPIFRSLVDSLMNYQGGFRKDMLQARENKPSPKPLSSGTLDPLGGGNLVRAVDLDTEGQILRSLEDSLINYQGRQNMMRLAREDKSIQRPSHLLGVVDPYRDGQIFRSLDHGHLMESLDNYQGGEVLRMLDAITGSDLLSSLDTAEGMAVLSALKKTHTKHPKRMLDSVSGWAFGESKRNIGESKRNFDEIDNVGFTSFAKKSPSPYYRKQYESLAKKNFDEIDRTGFDTYNKRNFDEIDRTGFETFEKRDRKE